jgi:hypothetical protein
MPLTPPPTPPNRSNPTLYSERADAMLGWLATFGAEYNADFGMRVGHAGQSYYSDTVTLNPGFFDNGTPDGCGFTFTVLTTNTGTVTLIVDGDSALGQTPQGAALPAGYLVPGVLYTAMREGAVWVIRRPPRRISNANGIALQYEDGTQICFFNFASTGTPNVAVGSLFNSGAGSDTWTFPAAFINTDVVVTGSTNLSGRWLAFSGITTTSVGINQFSATSAGTTANLRLMAIGRWY